MNTVTFFTKSDCSLCTAALFVIDRVRRQIPFELQCVDITSPGCEDAHLLYREHIPVIHINGREAFRHRVDERAFRRVLRQNSASSGPPPSVSK
jgi:glutaredoxin